MQMILNPDIPKSMFVKLALVCAAAILLFAGGLVRQVAAVSRYEQTEGMILSVDDKMEFYAVDDSGISIIHTVYYSYEVGGAEYTGRFRTLFPFVFRKGHTVKISYDPANPEQTADRFAVETDAVFLVFFAACLAFMLAAIRQKGNENGSWQDER